MSESVQPDSVAAVRSFNRFYTQQIGTLATGLHGSSFSLTEARLLYEIAKQEAPTPSTLSRTLDLDPGYVSRSIRALERRGLLRRRRSDRDGRKTHLSFTNRGQAAFADLDARAHESNARLLGRLDPLSTRRLLGAMGTIERILGEESNRPAGYLLRSPTSGDYGWIVHRHGALYSSEYGWNETFEALVARIVADFVDNHDPKWERSWVAELDGEVVGSVFLVKASETAAKLRLLYVEPHARGRGIGERLVQECIRFARAKGYMKLSLWTNDVLHAARRIYERAGFRLVSEEPHSRFGPPTVAQTWELEL
jgi:DNA-binding MarR family transcriptional regulator/GNAT superfamily N-acetyltransferase